MTKPRKTKDVWLMQSNYGYGDGWEDEVQEDTYSEPKDSKW